MGPLPAAQIPAQTTIILFTLTILKVLLYDFPSLGPATRTSLLIGIGVVLLAFSSAYPKIKKMAGKN